MYLKIGSKSLEDFVSEFFIVEISSETLPRPRETQKLKKNPLPVAPTESF